MVALTRPKPRRSPAREHAVLRLLANHGYPMTRYQLLARLTIPVTYTMLVTLAREGLIAPDEQHAISANVLDYNYIGAEWSITPKGLESL